jgi:glucosamine-phosphate N-acetyltransferase
MNNDKVVEIFKKIKSNPEHHIIVAEINGKIIGTTTLLIEPKFIHQGGLVGHIEDVVVDKNFQGKKIGEKIIKYVLEFSKNYGCYKTILDCSDNVKPFYEKLGFKHNSNELRFNHI